MLFRMLNAYAAWEYNSYRLVVEKVNLEAMVDVFIEALCSVTGHIGT